MVVWYMYGVSDKKTTDGKLCKRGEVTEETADGTADGSGTIEP